MRGVPTYLLKLDSGDVRARYISGSGTDGLVFAYTVQVDDYDEDGVSIVIPLGDSPIELDGSTIQAVADGSEVNLVADRTVRYSNGAHKVDARPPFVTSASISSSPASGTTYESGETITVSLATNQDVLVTGRPWIFVDVGGALRRADYIGPIGTATDALEFTYTVQAGDFDADGVALCASGTGCGSLQLNGGSIRGAADELEADLRLPALAAQSGHKVDAAEPLPVQPTACADETRVPDDWPLKPSSITVGGKFRLMFLSSTTRNATSANISDYNSFVQGRAAAGHTAIRTYSTGFRALGSTVSYDARDNTCTTGPGVAIHWLNGSKVADNNADLYDGGWDDEANPRTEGGAFRSPRRFWSGSSQQGTEQIRESGKSAALGAPNGEGAGGCDSAMLGELNNASHDPLSVIYSCNTNSYPLIAVSQVFKVPLANEAARATAISIISSPASGDTYRLGETIEFEVTFSEAVAVRGAPQLALVMRDASDDAASEFRAGYVRSSGTTKLVFAHAVAAGDRAAGGIATGAGEPLQLNGATITAVADGLAAVSGLTASSYIQAEGSRSKVDGSLVPSVGVCNRTLQVRDAIVAAVSDATDCSQVTSAHLAAIEGTLTVQGLTSLNAGDFAGLTAVEILLLRRGAIETLPVGVFDELGSVRSLAIDNGLTHLPRDIFRGLGDTLTRLGLLHNELAAGGLPDGIFEELTKLTSVQLIGNPGTDTFTTTADAGPGGTVSAGQTVTLGGPGNAGGPWGSNVTYEWTQTDGSDNAVSTVTLSATDVTNPGFTVPVLSAQTDVKLVLRVAGVGAFTSQHGTSTAEFSIRALAPIGLAVVSEPIDGTEFYKRGEKIEIAVNFSDRVVVAGTPQLALSVGVNTRNADYVRGTNSNQLVFEYTVVESDADTDGIVAGQNALALNGGAITSVYGAQAILTHTALAAQTGHKVDGSDRR